MVAEILASIVYDAVFWRGYLLVACSAVLLLSQLISFQGEKTEGLLFLKNIDYIVKK